LLAAQTGNWAAVAQLGKGANDIRDVHYRLNPDERTLRNQDPLREGGPAAEHQEGLGEGIARFSWRGNRGYRLALLLV
jgi:hypothetical protein